MFIFTLFFLILSRNIKIYTCYSAEPSQRDLTPNWMLASFGINLWFQPVITSVAFPGHYHWHLFIALSIYESVQPAQARQNLRCLHAQGR